MTILTAVNVETEEVELFDVLNLNAGSKSYKGLWNASLNEPYLVNGVGESGDYYEVSVGGTVNFGDGDIIFVEGDTVMYQAGKWNKGDKPLINDNDIALDTTWSSSKILQVIETSSTADVFTYKGETNELPDGTGETPNNKGDVWLLTTDGLPYWWNGDVWKRFGVDAYTKAETDTLLAGKVDKEEGKGLSTEDFTTAEKTKLAGIENGAEVNTIESISVNNVALSPDANKNVDITVPTKTSDLTNDSGFIDKTVNDLDNYYTESETDTLLSAKQPKTLDAPITVAGTIETTVEETLTALNSVKANTSDLATVATTGDYTDLSNTPTLGTASAKDSTTYVSPGNNDIPTSNSVYQAMTSMLEGAFHPAGNKTCAELTSDLLIQANVGHIYKITDNGTTDANWVGGAGQTITANQLAVVVYGNTAGTFLFNLENGINVDMSTYQTKAITPITVDGTVKSNVEDALDAINTLAGSNKTSLGNKTDKVSGATNGNFAGLDANGNLTDSGINKDIVPSNTSTLNKLVNRNGSVNNISPTNPWISDNFNNAKADYSGIYEFTVLNSAANTPNLGSNYTVIYVGFSETLGYQIAQQNDTNNIYQRSRTGTNTWSSWKRIQISISDPINDNIVTMDANGNIKNSGINADSLNDLQLTYDGSNYSTTSALITKLTSDIVARKHSAGTVGGNIAITWTGKSCITGNYSIHDSGAGLVILDFENDQDGKNHCVYIISNGSATGITWSKLATTDNLIRVTENEYQLQVGGDNYAWFDLGTSPNTGNSQAYLFYEITYGRVDAAQSKILVSCSGTMSDGNYFKIVNLNNAQTSAAEQFKIDSNKHLWLGMQSYCEAHVKVYGRWSGMGSKTTVEPTGTNLPIYKCVTENDLTSSVISGSTVPITSGGVYDYLAGSPLIGKVTTTLGRLGFGAPVDNFLEIKVCPSIEITNNPFGTSGNCLYIKMGIVEFVVGALSADASQWTPNTGVAYRVRHGMVWQSWHTLTQN